MELHTAAAHAVPAVGVPADGVFEGRASCRVLGARHERVPGNTNLAGP